MRPETLPRRRRPWRRFLFIAVAVLFALELAWLIAANVALNTAAVQNRINQHPEKLIVAWTSGRTVVPWRIRIEGIRVRGQGRRDQWYATADNADIRLRPTALFRKGIVTRAVNLRGVLFRLRPRLDAVPEGTVRAEDLPPIPGLENPPGVLPTFRSKRPGRRPWSLDLKGIHLTDLRELWIKEHRLIGSGELRATMQHEIRGPFITQVDSFTMGEAAFMARQAQILTNLTVRLHGQLGEIRFKVHRGMALYERMNAETEWEGDIVGLNPLLHLLRPEVPVEVRGTGRLAFATRIHEGAVEAVLREFSLPNGVVSLRGEPMATNLAVHIDGQLLDTPLRELKGSNVLDRLEFAATVGGDLLNAEVYQHHLGTVKSIQISGRGRIDARARVERGAIRPDTRIRLDSDNLQVRLVNVEASGKAQVAIDVVPPSQPDRDPTSTMVVSLERLRFRHKEDEAMAEPSGNLRLTARALDPRLVDGFNQVEVHLDLGPLELPDTRVLNPFLPESAGVSFIGGRFRVAATYADTPDTDGTGRIQLGGDQIEFRMGDRTFTGRLAAASDYTAGTNDFVHLANAVVLATNVTVSGVRNRQADGWHARVDVSDAVLALDGSRHISGNVAVDLLDIRPLLALLREDPDASSWARWIPNLKQLRGGARLDLGPDRVAIRDLALRAKATEILAQLTLNGSEPDGILYARYGLISAGFDFRGDKKSWTILGAKRAYLRALSEMGMEARVEAEDDKTNAELPDRN